MFLRSFSRIFILFFISVNFLLVGQSSETLKTQDISHVMQQILNQHVSQKEMSGKILKHAFKNYIDQFDPSRMYLLESEVNPYLQMDDAQANTLMDQYKNDDFSSFTKLNTLIKGSIERSRQIRKHFEEHKSDLFKSANNSGTELGDTWSDPDLKKIFSTNLQSLEKHIKGNLEHFIIAEKKRYGAEQVLRNQDHVLSMYENQLRNFENAYLGVDANGHPFTAAKQENLFVIHVLKALASSLDSHTTFFNTQEAYDMRVRLEKEFQGIGVVFQKVPTGIAVARLIEGGPAQKSGLIKINDLLTEINGESITGIEFDKIMEKIRGQNGTSISLTLSRANPAEEAATSGKIFHVKLVRDIIPINEDRVDVSYETVGNGIIGKITLHSFYQGENGVTSENDVKNAIKQLDAKGNLRGLILDLRENSGGFLSQAVKVAGLFITNGVVVISKYSNGNERIYRDMDNKAYYQGPLIILTSKATASAAEIVAQALQDYGVAIVVGDEHTYGKGTIQSQTVTDAEGGSFFKVTVGKYYTVSGKTPQIQGVKADILVPSQFSREHIGEEYLDQSFKPDSIPSKYSDKLADIEPGLKSWYMHYYVPTMQHRVENWDAMLPVLKKNSDYRITHNKNYQMFLKMLNGEKIQDEDEAIYGQGSSGVLHKNFGAEDLQMMEAVNIAKDMVYLQAHMRSNPADGLESSKATVGVIQELAK